RYQTIVESSKQLDGIIHHSVKFCDFYSFDYAYLKQKLDIPLLKIETDYTPQSEGQIRTRIEAFMESLGGKPSKTIKKQSNKIVAGIDSGSLSTNVVILDGNKNILSYSIVRTGAKSLDSAYRAFQEALEKANLTEKQISYVVSTGYGRISIPFSRKNVTEITCHGKGAFHLNNKIRTIIDIGGQDSKVIRLDENGEVIDFAMNDKCSAGTGRFLEVMAKTLEIPLEEMGPESLNSREEITITSMCTVFAESEVVSLIAQNKNKADLINGINNSIASRTIALLERVGGKGAYMMTGGVAKNIGVLKALENKIGEKIYVPEEPQIVGALGAALIALESLSEESKINQ
ncbi:MAG TPA: 3-hydroxyacyl-ACP dehydratase, partial [Clostridia bacterium]|nr:3-hydroxyacyl-ACP dehydratase [Clostridia bacterium]